MQMVNAFIIRFFSALMGNVFVQLLMIAVCADMVFGSLRAAKYHCWNSAVGIDGAIRKAGMLACVLLFTAIDMMMHVDVLGWLPADTRNVLDACGVVKMGVTELFALLFILYEATQRPEKYAPVRPAGACRPAGEAWRLAQHHDRGNQCGYCGRKGYALADCRWGHGGCSQTDI